MTIARAVTLWIVYVVLFNVAGGLAAGVLALVVDLLSAGFSEMLYAAVYAVTGFIGYRLAKKVIEGESTQIG